MWLASACSGEARQRLEPASERLPCGAGCRQVTTRLNFTVGHPFELSWAAGQMLSRPFDLGAAVVNGVDLARGEEWAYHLEPPEPGARSYAQIAGAGGCYVKQYVSTGAAGRRCDLVELCPARGRRRVVASASGAVDDPEVVLTPLAAGERWIIVSRGNAIEAVSLADGSRQRLASSVHLITQVSLHEPVVVLGVADGDIYSIDLDDGTRTNLSAHPALQQMAASDGRTVVWVDYRYGETPEIVAYDLASRTLRRLSQAASTKFFPTVEGRRVAWIDDRHSDRVGAPLDTPRDRLDVYTYDLDSGREQRVAVEAALYPSVPWLHDGRLYVIARAGERGQLFELALPAP